MRDFLTSTTGVMAAVLLVLVAVGIWAIFAEDDPEQAQRYDDATQVEEPRAVGGGPIEGDESQTDGEEPDTEPDTEPDELDEPDLETPEADREPSTEEPDEYDPQIDPQQPMSEPQPPGPPPDEVPEGADADQEAAFRADTAPEAEVIAVEPADSPSPREGGGPLDDEQTGDEQTADENDEDARAIEEEQTEEPPEEDQGGTEHLDEGRTTEPTQPQQVEDLMEQLQREESGGQVDPDRRAPIPPPSESPSADEPMIDRPSLRSAPRPSRPGEE
ncbi:hypothetical protein FIV42_28490 [Persicimonas caeni]|uniref:Uncharacterized protein n=1 Tax=Persicimonas caeni TaxID=2292766 RepID=A0A4Y6Q1R3_PERCE|nr:hypothetical protein [Persicimonas caeni]QDG54541.1 hypothetical protein FIV42_28490 [Persicimonas caeni]QED35762.1 hypothetical protein FRD00_28485 [Persicimonas caeni]